MCVCVPEELHLLQVFGSLENHVISEFLNINEIYSGYGYFCITIVNTYTYTYMYEN